MKKVLYPILAVIAFLFMQSAAGGAIAVAGALLNPEEARSIMARGDSNALMDLVNPNLLSLAIVMSGLLTIAIISLLKMIEWRQALNLSAVDWRNGTIAIMAAILGIFSLDIVEEMLDLPNLMEDTFTSMSNTLPGALCIGVVGPIIEEFIFREGIEGYMLRNGVNKWGAIVGSALAFGIIHINPAQVPFAAAMGLILGIIYYKSGNIVLTSILHILNNSVAVWMMYTMGDSAKDFSLTDTLGGTIDASFYAMSGIGLCILWLTVFWQRYRKSPAHPTQA